jgi:ribonuclease HII
MLKSSLTGDLIEAGCDEAGRGCLAGPVFAAAVILPADYRNPLLNDSKKLSAGLREKLRDIIERESICWAVSSVDNQTIDQVNILNASIMAMHQALDCLKTRPQLILVDGNRFHKYQDIPHRCIIKGDAIYQSIAAASVMAKTYRDNYMRLLAEQFPDYGWYSNKGYPTAVHRKALKIFGMTPFHRRSFKWEEPLDLFSKLL